MSSAIRGAKAALALGAAALLLSGCGANSDASDVFGNLLAFNSVNAPPAPEQAKVVRVDCPEVSPSGADSTVQIYAGPDHSNDDVKYQYDIAQYARQCQVVDGQLQIKVEVEGRVIVGPAGSSGSFVAPVQVAVERQSDGSVLVQKVYPTTVNVPQGVGVALFDTVTDPLVVPFTGEHADEVYQIKVGYAEPKAAAAPSRRRAKRRRPKV